jgi:hypothetical protein
MEFKKDDEGYTLIIGPRVVKTFLLIAWVLILLSSCHLLATYWL